MKKTFSFILLFTILVSCFTLDSGAASDPMAAKFQEALGLLDYFYDYDVNYMIRIANDHFVSYDNIGPVVVSAAEYEAVLHDHFLIDDSVIASIRTHGYEAVYNITDETYTVEWVGGFGGSLAPREYLGYVKNGDSYIVYYQNITYGYLCDVLPDEIDEYEYADEYGDPITGNVEYDGFIYVSGPEGYYTLKSFDDFGRKYTVEMNGETVRIISCTEYVKGEAPESFDDKEKNDVIYDVPENNTILIPENDCFEDDTVIKVEEVKSGDVFEVVKDTMKKVAEEYIVYEFTATKDNVSVQPSGEVFVTFSIPEGYSANVSVYYMSQNGNLEKLSSEVDQEAKTITATLSHFSTYILVDEDTRIQDDTLPETGATTIPDDTLPGTDDNENTNNDADQNNNNDKPDNKVLIIVISVICVIVISLAVLIILKKKK